MLTKSAMPRLAATLAAPVVIGLVLLLALTSHPARLVPHEPHRAGLLLVGMALLLPVTIWQMRAGLLRSSPLLWWAVLAWLLVLAISTAVALSPARALFGDLTRRTGLLTHLLIVSGGLVGALIAGRSAWVGRGFWLAGVIVASVTIAQAAGWIPNPDAPRAAGTIGVPVFAGGWLALALLWGLGGLPGLAGRARHAVPLPGTSSTDTFGQSPPVPAPPAGRDRVGWSLLYGVGLLLIAAGIVATGTRAALIAAVVGVGFGALTLTAVYHRRGLALLLLLLALIAGGGLVAITRLPADHPLMQVPLITRLSTLTDDSGADSTRRSRELIWGGSLAALAASPALATIDNTPDPFAALRPVVGYGLEAFETVFRPYITPELREREDARPVDRAHNDWLDTQITTGWLGVLVRAGLWAAVWVTALRRLHRWHWTGGLLPLVGALAAALVISLTGAVAYLPLSLTVGLLTGAALYLLLTTFRRDLPAPEPGAIRPVVLALAVLVAHLVDIQFSFTTILTGWSAWLAVGLLAGDNTQPVPSPLNPLSHRGRGDFSVTLTPPSLPVGEGGRGDEGSLSFSLTRLMLLHLLCLIPAALIAVYDARADVRLADGLRATTLDTAALEAVATAAALRPWADRSALYAGSLRVATGDLAQMDAAAASLHHAAWLNPYDGTIAYLLAQVHLIRANAAPDDTTYQAELTQAGTSFAAAVRLFPTDPVIWREYARSSFWLLGDDAAALMQINRALALDPDDFNAQGLRAQIELIPHTPGE